MDLLQVLFLFCFFSLDVFTIHSTSAILTYSTDRSVTANFALGFVTLRLSVYC